MEANAGRGVFDKRTTKKQTGYQGAMNVDPLIAIAIATPAVGALAWLFRLEGRIGNNESETRNLRKDVTYIRDRIDVALSGHWHKRETDEDDS